MFQTRRQDDTSEKELYRSGDKQSTQLRVQDNNHKDDHPTEENG